MGAFEGLGWVLGPHGLTALGGFTNFRVEQFLGFRVQGLWFRVYGLGLMVQGLGFRVYGSGCRVGITSRVASTLHPDSFCEGGGGVGASCEETRGRLLGLAELACD